MTPDQTVPVLTTAAQAPRRRSLGCIIGLIVLGMLAAGVIAVAMAAYSALRFGPEARELRDAAEQHFDASGSWHPQIEVRLGPLLCAVFREFVIRAADDPDATAVLRAARGVEFGLYRVEETITALERADFLRATTRSMSEQGWTRVVAVVDGSTTVAVFVPERLSNGGEIEMGVVVHDDQDLVIAMVRARVAPLLKLVQRHAREHGGFSIER